RNFLTIPITSATIIPPASLRSDYLIGIRRNADRLPSGTLIDFPRIRTKEGPPHHILPESGWVSVYLRQASDVDKAIEFLHLSFEIANQRTTK
ncbi:MAG TPA: luciferase family protein, partial [Bryobacteraceae bacterium]|nr:luciferase family protein [Bryobacteraceae bacterium]